MRKVLLMAALALAGCVVMPEERARRDAEVMQTAPVCDGENDCRAKWEAAQLWVVHHAAFKIQTATGVLIETYGASEMDSRLSARVTKEPLGGGKYRLDVNLWCSALECDPDPWDASKDFNRAVASVSP